MRNLLIFAGTTEGRVLAERLDKAGIGADVCVATEYGKELVMEGTTRHRIHAGRLDEKEMAALIRQRQITDVVDATHPYAVLVSENIHHAANETGCRYLRLLREDDDLAKEDGIVIVDSVEEAVHFLAGQEGNILSATGSNELKLYTQIPDYEHRVTARVLSTPESVEKAASLGFRGKNLICMQGPFSEELNVAMLRSCQAKWLVTKESGKTGGFPEKLRAAHKAGARLVVVGRPPQEEGYSLAQILEMLGIADGDADLTAGSGLQRTVYVIGIGMGNPDGMTMEAEKAIISSQALIGAGRMTECALKLLSGRQREENEARQIVNEYMPDKIRAWLDDHPDIQTACVLLSGDVGFYSGAKKLMDRLDGYIVRVCCGISSVVYLCGKLHTAWEDVKLVSLHGREQNLIAAVREHRKVFVLTGKKDSFLKMCQDLVRFGLGEVMISAGSNLSYPEEKIVTGKARNFAGETFCKESAQEFLALEKKALVQASPENEVLCGHGPTGAQDTQERNELFGHGPTGAQEEIPGGTSSEDRMDSVSDLAACLIENPAAFETVTHGLPDDRFLRAKVPMTKEEVRAVSLSKMHLHNDSIIYDVGAGTGSVSLEMALRARDGMVYAIEKKPEAVELIRANQIHLGVPNLEVVQGLAPQAMDGLPVPTHAFIGGSSGNLKEIVAALLEKNPYCRIVINAIALETVDEVLEIIDLFPVSDVDIACVNIGKSKSVGHYHMMMGQNPVYVISFSGE